MNKKEIRPWLMIAGSFAAYWIFCLVLIAQNFITA